MNNQHLLVKALIYSILIYQLGITGAFAQIPNSEAPGQGMNPAPEISGDSLPPPLVPSGISTDANDSVFPAKPEQIPLTIYLRTDTYSHNKMPQYMGKRTVLTLRTSVLNSIQKDLITTILELNSNSGSTNGEHAISLDVSASQLQEVQNVLNYGSMKGQTAQQPWLFHYLPIARKFCSWIILLGVVFATVMLSIAAYGIVMSHRGSVDKVISTVAGLIVLLMSFTIYRLLIANISNNQSPTQPAVARFDSSQLSSSLP